MIPLSDDVRSRTFPFVNVAIILANIVVFMYQVYLSDTFVVTAAGATTELEIFIDHWANVPACTLDAFGWDRVEAANSICRRQPDPRLTLLTSTFMHGGWLHVAGNMLFLWIFGDNVEDAMGHLAYLVFYLFVAVLSGLAQVVVTPDSTVPAVGASGAIAGVMAAYLILYPRATVHVLIPIIIIPWFTHLPAVVLMVLWFAIQVFSGLGEFGARATGGEGGVAWFAHIGGFVAGLVLVWFFRTRRRSHDEREQYDRFGWG